MFKRIIFNLNFILFYILIHPESQASMRIFCSDICQDSCFNFQSIRSDSKDRCECGPQFCGTEILCRKYRGENYVFNPNAKNRGERCLPKIIESSTPFPSMIPKAEIPPLMKEDEACSESAFQYVSNRKACIEGDPGRCLFSNSPEGVALAIVMSAEGQSRQLKKYFMDNPNGQAANQKALRELQERKRAQDFALEHKYTARANRLSRIIDLVSINLEFQRTNINFADVSVDDSSKELLRKEFPKEMPEIERVQNEFKKANLLAVEGKIGVDEMDDAFQKYHDQIEELSRKGAKYRTAVALATRSNYQQFITKPNLDELAKKSKERVMDQQKKTKNRYEKSFQIEMQKLKANQEKNFRKAGKGVTSVAAAAGAGIVAFAPGIMRRIEIESCQKFFDLSESDLNYLKGSFSPDPNADMIPRSELVGSSSCLDLSLANPLATYYELKKQYGFVPSGICRVLQRQVMRLEEKLTLPKEVQIRSISSDDDCKAAFKTPFTVDYKTAQGVRKITAPYIENGKSEMGMYPLFQGAKVYNEKGEYLPLQTQELVDAYHRLHNPRTRRPDAVDFSFLSDIEGIPQIQVVSNLIRASHKHRDDFNRVCVEETDSIQPSRPSKSNHPAAAVPTSN